MIQREVVWRIKREGWQVHPTANVTIWTGRQTKKIPSKKHISWWELKLSCGHLVMREAHDRPATLKTTGCRICSREVADARYVQRSQEALREARGL